MFECNALTRGYAFLPAPPLLRCLAICLLLTLGSGALLVAGPVIAGAETTPASSATTDSGPAYPSTYEQLGQAKPGLTVERRLAAGQVLQLELTTAPGARLAVVVTSPELDPLLHQLDATGELLAADDNGGPGLGARLQVKESVDGRLRLRILSSYADLDGMVRIDFQSPGTEVGAERIAFASTMARAADRGDDRLLLDAFRGYVNALSQAVGVDSALALVRELRHAELDPVASHADGAIFSDLGVVVLEINRRSYRPALVAGERARNASREQGQDALLGFAHLMIGTVHLMRNAPDIAMLELDRAIPQLDRMDQRDLAARARYQTGRALLRSDLDRAATLFETAASVWLERGDLPRAALAMIDHGTALRFQGKMSAASRQFDRAAAINERSGDLTSAGTALTALSEVHRSDGSFDLAETALVRALDIARRTDSKPQAATAMLGLARLARARGAYGVAVRNAELAHNLAQQAGIPYQFVDAEIILGNLAIRLDDLTAAERFLSEALRLSELYDFDDLRVQAGGRLGKLAVARHQANIAHGNLVNAARWYGEAGYQQARTDIAIDIAGEMAAVGRLTAAEDELRTNEQVIRRLTGNPGLLKLRAMRGRIWREEGRTAESRRELEAALAELPPADHDSGRRLYREYARTLAKLGDVDAAVEAYLQAVDHLLAGPPAGELGFDDGVLREHRDYFDEAIEYLADRGWFDRALELALVASEAEYRWRWAGRAAGLDRAADGAWSTPLTRPALDAVRAELDARGVTLITYRATPTRLLSWVLPAPDGLGAVARHASRDSLVLWNARILDSLTVGYEPQSLAILRQEIWAPLEAWVDPSRPVLVVPDLALGHLPLEIMAAGDGSGAAGIGLGTRVPITYATHPGSLIGVDVAPHRPDDSPTRLTIAYRPELPFSDQRRQLFSDWAATHGLETLIDAVPGEPQLQTLIATGGTILDLAYPCHVTRGQMVRSGLIVTDEYRPSSWSTAKIGADTQIPALVKDGRLTADEIRAADPDQVAMVALRTLCIEGDARPSSTLVEAFLAAGAGAVVMPRWGSVGGMAGTDEFLRDFYTAVLAGAPAGEALRLARERCLAEGGSALAASSWAVFMAR